MLDDLQNASASRLLPDLTIGVSAGFEFLMRGEPVSIFDVTGYLLHAAYGRNFSHDCFFTNPQHALIDFEMYMQEMRESLLETLSKLDKRVVEARAFIREEQTKKIEAITHG
jgi:hypothetical protein